MEAIEVLISGSKFGCGMQGRPAIREFCRFFLIVGLFVFIDSALAADRNPMWATPIDAAGVSNLHKVTDTIYRSAQPSTDGMKTLEWMGIKTVVNLRGFHSDKDRIRGTVLVERAVSMHAWNVDRTEVVKALRILTDPAGAPYLLHCQHGADRTGMIMAMYRIVVQGWSKEQAIDEMVNGGYGFHSVWSNIIDSVKKADIDAIRADLSISEER